MYFFDVSKFPAPLNEFRAPHKKFRVHLDDHCVKVNMNVRKKFKQKFYALSFLVTSLKFSKSFTLEFCINKHKL